MRYISITQTNTKKSLPLLIKKQKQLLNSPLREFLISQTLKLFSLLSPPIQKTKGQSGQAERHWITPKFIFSSSMRAGLSEATSHTLTVSSMEAVTRHPGQVGLMLNAVRGEKEECNGLGESVRRKKKSGGNGGRRWSRREKKVEE